MGFTHGLAFHAEKLHDDFTWRRVERVARWMAQQGVEATFVVYPFRAQVGRRDITDSVRMLTTLRHEIGQHTHFYAGTKIDKLEKVDDMSQANIVHCLYRDFEALQQTGFPPKGFTAGAWYMNQTILDTLVELGFAYDCSTQFPKPEERSENPSSYQHPFRRWGGAASLNPLPLPEAPWGRASGGMPAGAG